MKLLPPDELPWEVRIPSIAFDRVRVLKADRRFAGRVELRKVIADGLWDLIAIVDCEKEADAILVGGMGDEEL